MHVPMVVIAASAAAGFSIFAAAPLAAMPMPSAPEAVATGTLVDYVGYYGNDGGDYYYPRQRHYYHRDYNSYSYAPQHRYYVQPRRYYRPRYYAPQYDDYSAPQYYTPRYGY
jgi:hypothetical protein